jgi:hypothetical protein
MFIPRYSNFNTSKPESKSNVEKLFTFRMYKTTEKEDLIVLPL